MLLKWHPDFTLSQDLNPKLSATLGLCALYGVRDFRLEDDTLYPAMERVDGRLFLNYKFTSDLTFSGGYMYRDYPGSDGKNFEHRITQQLVYKTKTGRVGLDHRGRVEQRIFGNGYENRLRYRLGGKFPVGTEESGLCLLLTEELVYAFNSGNQSLENRFEAGMGWKFSENLKMDFKLQHRFKGLNDCQAVHMVTKVAYSL